MDKFSIFNYELSITNLQLRIFQFSIINAQVMRSEIKFRNGIVANCAHIQAVSCCHFDQREKSPSRLVHIKRSFPAPPSLERTGVMISVFYPAILPLQGEISRCSVYGALPRAVAIFDLRPITDCRLKNEIFINFFSIRKEKSLKGFKNLARRNASCLM